MDIQIQHLTKVYRDNVRALNDISMTIPSGMFGLLGPNGAGKTTLMRILAGILHPSQGEVLVGPYHLSVNRERQAVKQTLGYLPQDLGMYPDLTAREFLDYVGILKGLRNSKQRRQRVQELLETVSLTDVSRRALKTFSGGMKRRVGIAQALLNDPKLLIVDEPTAGLDPEERIRFRNLLSDLGGQRTVILSTHIVEDIAQTCNIIAILKSGQVVFQGSIAELVQQTQDKVWLINSNGRKPEGDFTVVSALNLGETVQYRVVGELPSSLAGVAAQPNLEDGYVWLMRQQSQSFSPVER